jgi:hypothetical protein
MNKHIIYVKSQDLIDKLIANGYTTQYNTMPYSSNVEQKVRNSIFLLVIPSKKIFEVIDYNTAIDIVDNTDDVKFSKSQEILD